MATNNRGPSGRFTQDGLTVSHLQQELLQKGLTTAHLSQALGGGAAPAQGQGGSTTPAAPASSTPANSGQQK